MFANRFLNDIRTKLICQNYNWPPVKKYHLSCTTFAGHSKWANIRHIKAAKDGQKSMIFTKLSRQIRLAIQDGGSVNPALNSLLRNAIEDAQKRNMPNTKIQAILKKHSSSDNQLKLRKHLLELKAPNNIFLICVLYTDNLTQLRQTIAPILRKNLVTSTSLDIQHLFIEKGIIETVPQLDNLKTEFTSRPTQMALEELCTEHAIDCGAEEVEIVNFQTQTVSFFCEPRDLDRIRTKLTEIGYGIEYAEHVFLPKTGIQLNPNDLQNHRNFKEKLLAVDGVDEIFDNVLDE